MSSALSQELENRFIELFGEAPQFAVRAPGRVNLIGEHTDYNDGYVFPCAIERSIWMAASPRSDGQVRAYALNFQKSATFSLHSIEKAQNPEDSWSDYLRAIAAILQREGYALQGLNIVTHGTVPIGSGLSSSASMLVAGGLLFASAIGVGIDLKRLALLAQRAEIEFVGVNVGIMDQFISALGRRDHALFIDTRTLGYDAVPLPSEGVQIVIADTNKKRGLVDSEYNTRHSECEQAVALLKESLPAITALRDVSVEEFERCAASLPAVVRRRAKHVITENARVLESVEALKAGDIARFGWLMNASHESLKDDYEVSCAELDALVAASRSIEGVYGSRMTGAGFGGCTVSLVADSAIEAFKAQVPALYKSATGLDAVIYTTKAEQGAERLR